MNLPARDAAGRFQIGLGGARGYVGSELIKLIAGHPVFDLNFVASREREGRARAEYEPTRGFYEARGYRAVSRIPDFYAPGDDQVVYTKSLSQKDG